MTSRSTPPHVSPADRENGEPERQSITPSQRRKSHTRTRRCLYSSRQDRRGRLWCGVQGSPQGVGSASRHQTGPSRFRPSGDYQGNIHHATMRQVGKEKGTARVLLVLCVVWRYFRGLGCWLVGSVVGVIGGCWRFFILASLSPLLPPPHTLLYSQYVVKYFGSYFKNTDLWVSERPESGSYRVGGCEEDCVYVFPSTFVVQEVAIVAHLDCL